MTRVCLKCGAEYQGQHNRPRYAQCPSCDEKTYFGTESQYDATEY